MGLRRTLHGYYGLSIVCPANGVVYSGLEVGRIKKLETDAVVYKVAAIGCKHPNLNIW